MSNPQAELDRRIAMEALAADEPCVRPRLAWLYRRRLDEFADVGKRVFGAGWQRHGAWYLASGWRLAYHPAGCLFGGEALYTPSAGALRLLEATARDPAATLRVLDVISKATRELPGYG